MHVNVLSRRSVVAIHCILSLPQREIRKLVSKDRTVVLTLLHTGNDKSYETQEVDATLWFGAGIDPTQVRLFITQIDSLIMTTCLDLYIYRASKK